MSDEILTLPEIAEKTRVPLNTLRYYRSRGIGPKTWKCGRHVVAYASDVEAWLTGQYEKAGA